MKKNFWKNRKVFITGHTGFKGSWLTLILSGLKAKIAGYALDPISKPNLFYGLGLGKLLEKDHRKNILNLKHLKLAVDNFKPSIVFHLAAQSSVLVSYDRPLDTINVNVTGTANVLNVLRSCKSVRSVIIVTTDKVYLNLEKNFPFNENDNLGGNDVYSGSKAAAEIITQSFKKSFFSKNTKCKIATARSGNCIGGGDWTKDRILKDCAESFLKQKKLKIRSPNATRPWQHVIEPLFGYIKLSERLFSNKKYEGAWNFGPNPRSDLTVLEVVRFGKKFLKSKSKIVIKKNKHYESKYLSLNSKKSEKYLKWKTILNAKQALKLSYDWYRFYDQNISKNKIVEFTLKQISDYKKKLRIL